MANQRDFPRRDARPRTIVRRPRPSVGERRVVTRPAQRRGVEQPREAIDFTNALSLQMPRRWLLVACVISAFAVLAGAGSLSSGGTSTHSSMEPSLRASGAGPDADQVGGPRR